MPITTSNNPAVTISPGTVAYYVNQNLTSGSMSAIPIGVPAGGIFMLPAGTATIGGTGSQMTQGTISSLGLTGDYSVTLGQYTALQVFDNALDMWRNVHVQPLSSVRVSSNGSNFRIANTSGCPIGAIIKSSGSGMKDGINTVSVSASSGGSQWNTIVGGAVFGSAAIQSGGSGYQAPPILVAIPPPNQGDQPYFLPTLICTISNGVVNSVTITNYGAGLVDVPTVAVIPQPGDTTGSGAAISFPVPIVATSGSLTAIYIAGATKSSLGTKKLVQQPSPYGSPVTSVPSLAFSGVGTMPQAVPIMNFSITGFSAIISGAGYTNAGGVLYGGVNADLGLSMPANPALDKSLSIPIYPPITVDPTSGYPTLAALTNNSGLVAFGGANFQTKPIYRPYNNGTTNPTTPSVISVNVGGIDDVIFINPW